MLGWQFLPESRFKTDRLGRSEASRDSLGSAHRQLPNHRDTFSRSTKPRPSSEPLEPTKYCVRLCTVWLHIRVFPSRGPRG